MTRAAPRTSTRTAAQVTEHARVRDQHAIEAAEDYCEAIAELLAAGEEARVTSLARKFTLSHVTVSRVIGRLQREGYVRTAPYAPIVLTAKGRKLADASRARHAAVLAFLLSLGVDETTARLDAEGIEYHVSPGTLAAFAAFVSGQSTTRKPAAGRSTQES